AARTRRTRAPGRDRARALLVRRGRWRLRGGAAIAPERRLGTARATAPQAVEAGDGSGHRDCARTRRRVAAPERGAVHGWARRPRHTWRRGRLRARARRRARPAGAGPRGGAPQPAPPPPRARGP